MTNMRGRKTETKEGDTVYVMRRANGDLKFGATENLRSRWWHLCGEYGEGLEILATMHGYTTEEKAIHERFAEYRIYHIRATTRKADVPTDWFMPSPEIYKWIEVNMTPYLEPLSLYSGSTDGLRRYYKNDGDLRFNPETNKFEWTGNDYCVLPHMSEYPLKHSK